MSDRVTEEMAERLRNGKPSVEQAAGVAFGYMIAMREMTPGASSVNDADADRFVAEYALRWSDDNGQTVQGAWRCFTRHGSLFADEY